MIFREEKPSDIAGIRRLLSAAFSSKAEAELVDQLRSQEPSYHSLICSFEDRIVGYILFTPVSVAHNPKNLSACGLAPMAVLPNVQNQGIGSKLVYKGLEDCKKSGYDLVVVLGHARYYPRFGFRPASQFGLKSEYEVPEEAFMALELQEGALSKVSGLVSYHHLFNEV